MPILTVENITCGYGGKDVVRDVSFTLERGEILSIAGENGCGKTTLLRAVCGLIPIKSGGAYIDGKLISEMSVKERARRIAMLSQTGAGGDYSDYTVMDTVILGRYSRQRSGIFSEVSAEDKAAAEKYIAETGLQGLEDRLITELSGGQLQRVFLARTFAQEPDVIFLDEPANHLDLKMQTVLAEHLRKWVLDGKSVVGVFHDLGFAAAVSDRIMLLKDGKKILCGETKEVLRSEKLNEAFDTDVKAYMKKIADIWK